MIFCLNCEQEIEDRADPSMGWPSREHWVHVHNGASICGGVTGLHHRATPEMESDNG